MALEDYTASRTAINPYTALSLEFLGGLVVGILLVVLPLTPRVYVGLSVAAILIAAHIVWRITKLVGIERSTYRGVLSAIVAGLLTATLVWSFDVRYANAATPNPALGTQQSGPATGPAAEGIHNGSTTNNFYSTPTANPAPVPKPNPRRAASANPCPKPSPSSKGITFNGLVVEDHDRGIVMHGNSNIADIENSTINGTDEAIEMNDKSKIGKIGCTTINEQTPRWMHH